MTTPRIQRVKVYAMARFAEQLPVGDTAFYLDTDMVITDDAVLSDVVGLWLAVDVRSYWTGCCKAVNYTVCVNTGAVGFSHTATHRLWQWWRSRHTLATDFSKHVNRSTLTTWPWEQDYLSHMLSHGQLYATGFFKERKGGPTGSVVDHIHHATHYHDNRRGLAYVQHIPWTTWWMRSKRRRGPKGSQGPTSRAA